MSNYSLQLQGLDTLKNEHHQILNSLLSSMKTIKKENGDTNLVEEKTYILKKALETIDLGIGEAQVCTKLILVVIYAHSVNNSKQFFHIVQNSKTTYSLQTEIHLRH